MAAPHHYQNHQHWQYCSNPTHNITAGVISIDSIVQTLHTTSLPVSSALTVLFKPYTQHHCRCHQHWQYCSNPTHHITTSIISIDSIVQTLHTTSAIVPWLRTECRAAWKRQGMSVEWHRHQASCQDNEQLELVSVCHQPTVTWRWSTHTQHIPVSFKTFTKSDYARLIWNLLRLTESAPAHNVSKYLLTESCTYKQFNQQWWSAHQFLSDFITPVSTKPQWTTVDLHIITSHHDIKTSRHHHVTSRHQDLTTSSCDITTS